MNILKIKQIKTTIRCANDAGLFDTPSCSAFVSTDWKLRVTFHGDDTLYVYVYQGHVIGWIQGEVADFETLAEWASGEWKAGPKLAAFAI